MANKPLPEYERLHQILIYDPITGIFTWRQRDIAEFIDPVDGKAWNTKFAGKVAGNKQPNPLKYVTIRITSYGFYAHRLAWKMMMGTDPANEVDHKDLDRQNNIWTNLRAATPSQNSVNKVARSDSQTGVKGVFLHSEGRYVARIFINKKIKHLGYFYSIEDARAAYCKAAHELHGEFWNPG